MTTHAGCRSGWLALLFVALSCGPASAFPWFSRYSPVDHERPLRPRTDYIILHTTEAAGDSAFNKLWRNGEAHYLVDRSGRVRQIIRQDKVAYHAGLSLWNGRQNIDKYSVGIEVVGYHNGSLTEAQASALRSLLVELKRVYRVSDNRVLTHSMVAYGAPNKWFRTAHRGRKRCGMLFALRSVRARLDCTASRVTIRMSRRVG